ncbi:MAG: hypothetical protein M1830_006083 [Pleopsidium flavum]|nr:MAG: hypothetical protein M1830_006083 [Pleopsidium flavum]
MHKLSRRKSQNDRRTEYPILGAGVLLGAVAGLGAPPGLTTVLSRRSSSSLSKWDLQKISDSKAGARHFTEKLLELLKGGGETTSKDDPRFADLKVTSPSSHTKDQGAPKTEVVDFSEEIATVPTNDVVDGIDSVVEDIEVYESDRVLKMKALLDTGMEPNMICRTMVEASQLVIEDYSGPEVQTADGRRFKPEGQVAIHFYFPNGGRAKSYRIKLLIAPEDAPFDVALGLRFIQRAQVFVKNPAGYVLHMAKESKEQRATREMKEKERKACNDLIAAQRADASGRKRQEQRSTTSSSASASSSSGRSAGRSGSGASNSTG